MIDLEKARKRLTDLVDGLRVCHEIKKADGSSEYMTPLQRKVFSAYARQIERVVEEVLTEQ